MEKFNIDISDIASQINVDDLVDEYDKSMRDDYDYSGGYGYDYNNHDYDIDDLFERS